jgi:hypothetical protein
MLAARLPSIAEVINLYSPDDYYGGNKLVG